MNLRLTPDEEEFVAAVQAFLAQHWPAQWRQPMVPGPRLWQAQTRYTEALVAAGWLVPDWPAEFGGQGWSARKRWLFDQAAAAIDAPQGPLVGPRLLGPLLIEQGSAAQQRLVLPEIARGHRRWCQAFDEDTGGLDFAAIQTQVKRDPGSGNLRLDGVKPWVLDALPRDSTGAIGFCVLARTETDGFALLLVDATTPGVVVEAKQMLGETAATASMSEVRFADVLVSADSVVGALGQGQQLVELWQQWEMMLAGSTARNARLLRGLREWVESGQQDDGALWSDEDFRHALHAAEIELAGLEALELRALASSQAKFANAARLALVSRSAELGQRLADLQVSALGYFALPFVDFSALENEGSIGPEFAQPALLGMLSDRARAAVGAPVEHLKNIIAKSVLALPVDAGHTG